MKWLATYSHGWMGASLRGCLSSSSSHSHAGITTWQQSIRLCAIKLFRHITWWIGTRWTETYTLVVTSQNSMLCCIFPEACNQISYNRSHWQWGSAKRLVPESLPSLRVSRTEHRFCMNVTDKVVWEWTTLHFLVTTSYSEFAESKTINSRSPNFKCHIYHYACIDWMSLCLNEVTKKSCGLS